METWGKTCTDCNWNTVCTHKKVLYDGQEYKYITACCRSMNGMTFIPSSLPSEPQDWYLWKTIRGLTIYGRAQFIPITEKDMGLVVANTHSASHRTTKVLSRSSDLSQGNPMAKPLAGLKSVYDTGPSDQGSLF